jgi:hypothetical protein
MTGLIPTAFVEKHECVTTFAPSAAGAADAIDSDALADLSNAAAAAAVAPLLHGAVLLKFGRHSVTPHRRFVRLTPCGHLLWDETEAGVDTAAAAFAVNKVQRDEHAKDVAGGHNLNYNDLSGGLSALRLKRALDLTDVTGVVVGVATSVLKRSALAAKASTTVAKLTRRKSVDEGKIEANLCFSVVTAIGRSFDLQAESVEQREAWVTALRVATARWHLDGTLPLALGSANEGGEGVADDVVVADADEAK